MERFYIITNLIKDRDYRITREIQAYIEQHGKRCIRQKKMPMVLFYPEQYPGTLTAGLFLVEMEL